MKRYPEYKDSGAPWLGRVPAHWPMVRYKYLFREKHPKKDSTLQAGAISFGRVVFKDDEMLPPATKASYQEVRKGEYLINPINLNYDLKSLRTALSEIDVCVSPAYIVLRPLMDSDPGYLKYQLHLFDVCHMKTLGAGVRQTISFGDVGVCGTIVPPKEEQAAIASFLDRVVGEIDSTIASQERMIELLKERRSAIITQAVTKGLDSKAKMKDSGIPWLGQVPRHWQVKKLKRAFSEISEKAKPGDEQLAATQKFGVISQSQFMKDQDQKLVLALKGTDNFKHLEKDDFVISLRAFEGGIERSSQSGCVSPAYTVLRSKGEVSPGFAARLLKTPEFISQISMTYDGIREGKAIKFKDAGPVPLPIPPAAEQSAITAFIDGVLFKMDSAIASQERMIELLKERRSAIITQAVTGQIDVR